MKQAQADITLIQLIKTKTIPQHTQSINISTNTLDFSSQSQILKRMSKKILVHLSKGGYYYGTVQNRKANDTQAVVIFFDGSYYQGECNKGAIQGKGKLVKYSFDVKDIVYSYEGDWVNGRPHGKGKEIIANSMTYEGEFRDGKKYGKGIMIYRDDSKYQGEFRDNQIQGEGCFTTNAHKWTGTWREGYLQGQGVQISYAQKEEDQDQQSESTYEGTFQRGLKHGNGVYKWGKGISQYQGLFKNGQLDGQGTFKLGNTEYQGEWKKGVQIYMDTRSTIQLKKKNIKSKSNPKDLQIDIDQ